MAKCIVVFQVMVQAWEYDDEFFSPAGMRPEGPLFKDRKVANAWRRQLTKLQRTEKKDCIDEGARPIIEERKLME